MKLFHCMGGAVQKRNETYLKAKQIYEHLISVSFETSESFKNNIIIEIWFSERMPWTHASIFIKSHTAASGVLADYHKYWKIKIILVTHYRLTNLSSNSPPSIRIFLHQLTPILGWGPYPLFRQKLRIDQIVKLWNDETKFCTANNHT